MAARHFALPCLNTVCYFAPLHTFDLFDQAHPDWKYIFWSDKSARDFIKKEYPWFLETFDAYKHPIQRADAIRYFALYHFGGLYADMDLTPKQNVEGLIGGADVILFETPNLGMTNMIMAAKKGSPFIRCLTENLRYHQNIWVNLIGKAPTLSSATLASSRY